MVGALKGALKFVVVVVVAVAAVLPGVPLIVSVNIKNKYYYRKSFLKRDFCLQKNSWNRESARVELN